MALGNLAGNVGDERCDPGMDAQESSHGKQTGGTATEFLGGFTPFALAFCCDIADVIVVCFLSEPDGMSAFIDGIPRNDRKITFGIYGPRKDHSLSGTGRNLNCLRSRRLLVRA